MSNTSIMSNKNGIFNEKTFIVWLFIVASSMLFIAFSSAYWVHMSDGVKNNAWLKFDLPIQFWISAGIVIVSSIFMQLAYRAAGKDDVYKVPSLLSITFLLGIAFTISQVYAYFALMDMGLFLSNNEAGEISASFVYVISGAHLLHIVGGLILLLVGIVKASRLEIHKKNMIFINVCKTYWHFLGIVWIFLILFLYFAR
ncbi:MAG: cytochrome c oxidase subunit 3 [Bacteroidia bacterium]